MTRRIATLAVFSLSAVVSVFAQDYKAEPLNSPPPGLPAAYASVLQPTGYRVSGPSGVWCEIWAVKSLPATKSTDASIAFGIPQGTLIGVLRFPNKGADRRGQVIPAGVYTIRYSQFPVDGAHSGAAPQRDFGLLTPIASDADPNATPGFDALVASSKTASGTPHPAVFSLETPPSGGTPGKIVKEGENDWTLTLKAGDLTFSIILVGKVEG